MPRDDHYLYVKFDGPAADDGELDIQKAGRALVALGRWKNKYRKEYRSKDVDFTLKIKNVEKNCTELQIALEIVNKVSDPAINIGVAAAIAHFPGVKDFLREVGGELGRQLNIKMFSKGNNLTETDLYAKDGRIFVRAVNDAGEIFEIEKKKLDFYRNSHHTLDGFYNLEADKETGTRVGYYTPEEGYVDTATITLEDKDAFVSDFDQDNLAARMSEPFEDSKSTEELIEGQFVDFHGMAHKYKFSFQARKKQDDYGKQKILCIVDESKVSEIIDLLKPENKKNICIKGKATRDKEGRLDKILIEWVNEDPNFNPDQTSLIDLKNNI